MNPILPTLVADLIFGGNTAGYTPGASLWIALLDSSGNEITSVPRVQYDCTRFNWFDTSGGVDALSSGPKKKTANTTSIRFATPTANYTPAMVGVFTASTGGDLLFSSAFSNTYSVLSTDTYGPQIYANDLNLAFYDMSSYPTTAPKFGLSEYGSSRIIDFLLRGNPGSFVFPTEFELALMIDDKGTEVSFTGTGYNRVSIQTGVNLTVAGGVVTASSTLTFPSVIQNWGNVYGIRVYDTSGNIWVEQALDNPVRVEYGDEAPYLPNGTALFAFV